MLRVVVIDMLSCYVIFFFFKQKTAYEMRISDWSSDVCSSDLLVGPGTRVRGNASEGGARMRLAVLQMEAVAGDVAANLALIDAAAGQAAAGGARLLVAPELALTGYGPGEALRDLAEPADGPQVARLRQLAKAEGLGLVATS